MPFPEFEPGKVGILFFSRGRGRGHAIPDAQIADELLRMRGGVDVRFASYATGAQTLAERGYDLIDLDLPEKNPIFPTLEIAGKLIGWLRPALVVAHEEFAAVPAARIFDVPVVFLTDWFVEPGRISMQMIKSADEILFLDDPGIFEEPSFLAGKVKYMGPILPKFDYTKADRERARRELDIAPAAAVISVNVYPGRRSEEIAPICDLLMPAFDALEDEGKILVWNAGEDYEALVKKTDGRQDVKILKEDRQTNRLMAASDVAITKGNRNVVLELAALGVPSVTITHELNRIDDFRTSRTDGNITVKADEVTPATLCSYIAKQLFRSKTVSDETPTAAHNGALAVAEHLARIAGCTS